jgi:hypothetical protein
MKAVSAFAAAVFLFSGVAFAQTYSTGQRVEAMNPTTGKWESATITRIDGGRYLLHSDNAALNDWDVGSNEIRIGGASSSSSSASSFSSRPSSGSLGSLPADGAPTPLNPPADNSSPDDNVPAEPR